MKKAEEALKLFNEGYNCAQAVLAVFSETLGLDKNKALQLSSGFGAGMARTDQVCGAVSGAVMAIGLKCGGEKEKKEATYAKIKEFTEKFKTKNKSLSCSGLIGCNMSTEAGFKEAKRKEAHTKLCPKFVEDAVEILEEIL